MITIKAQHRLPLMIGIEGENNARQVEFDISEFIATFGDGVAQLIFKRPKDNDPYPCIITKNGNTVTWTITNVETAQAGTAGACELSYYVDNVLVKSEIWQVIVKDAMGMPSEDAPEPYRSWVNQVLESGIRAEADRIKVEATAIEVETAAIEAKLNAQISAENREVAVASADRAKSLADQVGVNSGLQSDWNQNDPTKEGYVQNRTHYEEHLEDIIIPLDNYLFNSATVDSSGKPKYYSCTDISKTLYKELEDNTPCVVVIQDKVYESVYKRDDYHGYIGNYSFMKLELEPGEPFLIDFIKHTNRVQIHTNLFTDYGSYPIKVYIPNVVIHPIPTKFMRLTSPDGNVFELTVNNDGTLGTVPVT